MHTALYVLLGLTPEATKAQIRKAYLLKALKTHPDRKTNSSETEVEEFKSMKQAYETLYDDDKRREYDTRPPTPPLESSFPRSRPQPHRSNASTGDPSSHQPPLSRSQRTTFGPSPRHSSYPYPPSPHGSDSSDEHDASLSDSESTLSEPEEELPHHFRSSHYSQHHSHPHRWTDDGDFHDYVDGEEDSVSLAMKEAEWAEQDRRENAKRESIREGLRNGGAQGRVGTSRPSSPVREGGRPRPSTLPRSRSYASPPYGSSRTSSPPSSPFHDDDEYRSSRDDRRTRSYPSAEEGRRERVAGSRARPSSPERERVESRGPRPGGFAQDPRMRRKPSYDYIPSPPPMPPTRPLSSSNFNRTLPPSPNYTHLRPNHLPPLPPLSPPQNTRSRPIASWKAVDYSPSPKGFSQGPPPTSYFPIPPNSRQARASTSPFPTPPQFIASPRSNSSPMPSRMNVGRTRSGEMMARRR